MSWTCSTAISAGNMAEGSGEAEGSHTADGLAGMLRTGEGNGEGKQTRKGQRQSNRSVVFLNVWEVLKKLYKKKKE